MDLGIDFGVTTLSMRMDKPGSRMQPAVQNNMFDAGFGLSLSHLSNPYTWGNNERNSAIRLGGEVGYTYYGRVKRDGVRLSYGMIPLVAMVRIQPPHTHPIMPFADIFSGGHFYLANIKEDLDAVETIVGFEPMIFDMRMSASFVYGIGGGLYIGSRNPQKCRAQLRFTYTRGTSFRYVERNSFVVDDAIHLQTARARVDYFSVQIGLSGFTIK